MRDIYKFRCNSILDLPQGFEIEHVYGAANNNTQIILQLPQGYEAAILSWNVSLQSISANTTGELYLTDGGGQFMRGLSKLQAYAGQGQAIDNRVHICPIWIEGMEQLRLTSNSVSAYISTSILLAVYK